MDLLPKVFRTEGNIAEFDPTKIYESILKETGMNDKDARHITELVVRRIISIGIKFLSGPHIREIVCSILSEQHFEDERKLYTRIGMPLMDYEKILIKGPSDKPHEWINPEKIHHWSANQIAEEYAHLRVLETEESRAHLAGDIHINGLNYFVLRPFSQIWDPRLILEHGLPPTKNLKEYYKYSPAKNLYSALYQLNKWLELMQNEFYGNQGYIFIDTFLSPYLSDLSEMEMIKEIRSFIYENNLLALTIGREIPPISIFSSISILEGLLNAPAINPGGRMKNTYENYQNQSIQFFKALLFAFRKISQKDPNLSIPKNYVMIDSKFMNLIESIFPKFLEEKKLIGSFYFSTNNPNSYRFKHLEYLLKSKYHNYGILQNISLNLPRYAFITKDEDRFLELLKSKLLLCSNVLLKKYDIIKKRIDSKHLPFCGLTVAGGPIFKLENQGLSVSLVGLNEAIKYITNYDIHENLEAIAFSKKILTEINQLFLELSKKHNKTFILSENLSEKAINRFTQLDLRSFPNEVKFVSNNRSYTNSVHFYENADINLMDRVKIQEDFHKYIHEGAITFISLEDFKRTSLNIKDLLSKISKESKISNLKFLVE